MDISTVSPAGMLLPEALCTLNDTVLVVESLAKVRPLDETDTDVQMEMLGLHSGSVKFTCICAAGLLIKN